VRRLVDRDERRRARRQHVDARPAQVELVADTRREEVLVVAGVPDQEHADPPHEVRVGQDVVQQVGVHAAAGEHADAAREPFRHVAGVFERLPHALEEHAVLRIEQRRVARRQAEEPGVELVDVGEQHRRLDVVGITELFLRHAERPQVLVRQLDARVPPIAEQAPELVEVAGAGQPAGHADHGDVGLSHGSGGGRVRWRSATGVGL
jgi:hypothetical protein